MTFAALTLVATPLLAFAGAGVGHWVTWRNANQLDRWRRREETMRMLRWAAELAGSGEALRVDTGLSALYALLDSDLLHGSDVGLVVAVLEPLRRDSAALSSYADAEEDPDA